MGENKTVKNKIKTAWKTKQHDFPHTVELRYGNQIKPKFLRSGNKLFELL